jgi:hypothetical protein
VRGGMCALMCVQAAAAWCAPRYGIWPESSLVKVFRDSPAPPVPRRSLDLDAVRNEVVAGQVVVTAVSGELAAVRVSVGDLAGERATIAHECVSVLLPHYVRVDRPSGNRINRPLDWPDPLPPAEPFPVAEGQNQPVWISVRVPAAAPPGDYAGEVVVTPENAPSASLPLRLRVHPPVLPEVPASRTSFNVWWDGIAQRFGLQRGTPEFAQVAGRFYWFLLQHRLSPMEPPVDIMSPEADRYLRDPRLTSVRLPFDRARLPAIIQRARTASWFPKAYVYLYDEPPLSVFPTVLADGALARGLDPDIRRLDTIQPDRRLDGAVDIWCPNLEAFYLYERSVRWRQSRGDEIWWYTCVSPKYPFPTFLLDDDAIAPRALFWMQAMYGVRGCLYINTIHWGPPGWDPWARSVISMPEARNNGDGLLMYTGRDVNPEVGERRADGSLVTSPLALAHPVTSIRLESIRDGLEDYDLLQLLAKAVDEAKERLGASDLPYGGQSRVAEVCGVFVKDLRDWRRDPAGLEAARQQVIVDLASLAERPYAVIGSDPPDYGETAGRKATIFGAVERGATVEVGETVLTPDTPGRFAVTLPLAEGTNRVRIAITAGSHRKELEKHLLVQPPERPRFDEPAKVLDCVRASGPVQLDGRLDEPDWQRVLRGERPGLRTMAALSRNLNGSIWPRESTVAGALYDDASLYIAIVGAESASGRIVAREHARDHVASDEDAFAMWLAADGPRSRWEFVVNAAGAQTDAFAQGGGLMSFAWNGTWRCRTLIEEDGWTVEVAIPWTDLGMPAPPVGQALYINFARREIAHGERTWWSSRWADRDQFEKLGQLRLEPAPTP